jgi:tetratricopeptide (TPR) repeat protein
MKTALKLIIPILLVVCITVALANAASNSKSKPVENQKETPNVGELNRQLPEAQLPVMKINGKTDSTEVYLQSLDIQVEVTGNIASTKYVLTFKNRTGKILEGELLFPLPDGVTVSHYALDINGKMREAVPVEKAKATQVFEEIEQRRVDPGLLERVEGNNFRTRIYPIPANGTRTISIGYEEELTVENASFYYRLPMAYKEAIENFSLKATVWKSKVKPQIEGKLSDELVFDEQGENFVATFARKNYQTERALIFSLPAPTEIPQVLMQPASGSYYFVASCLPKTETRKKQWGDQLGIIWDASLSGLQRDITKELEALDIIVKEKKNLTVSLYFLNNRLTKNGTYKIQNGNWSDIRKAIESVTYDGGTNFSAIQLKNISSEEFLFFSDGLSSLSHADFIALDGEIKNRPIHCVVSSSKADYSSMKWIASQTNGKFVNLNALSSDNLKKELLYETLHFLGIEANNAVKEVYPSVSTPVNGHFSVAGISDAPQTKLTLLFGYGNHVEKKISVTLNAKNATQQGNVHRIWAQKKINELDMRYEQNKEELTELGQQFGIVTRNTSLIVLETIQDYITYNIVPPTELQAEYFHWKKGQTEEILRRHQDFLNGAIEAAKELQEWWKKDFKPKKPKYPQPDKKEENRDELYEVRAITEEDIMESQSEIFLADVAVRDEERVDIADLQDHKIVVQESANFTTPVIMADATVREEAALYKQVNSTTRSVSQPVIRLTPLKQDNEYTKQLTGKADADYVIYLQLRADYINTPTFFFDMADWFFKLNDREKAIRILTSIADLDLENASLFRLLGYRLKEYKEYRLEAFICKKVIQWRPMEPQSYRDYALALADNGQYQAALDSLYSVITQSYAQNINSRSGGIEEVVVTELNQLISKNPKLNTTSIDPKLIKAMPVDIRVVINWNMNSTDIDLHVKDPHGVTCYYGQRSTEIGGRISRDITQGYGPEQFMLKKAVKGKYEVFINYFGDSQVKAEGPSTIMAEIYTRYSDKTEQRQVVCLQMSKENKQTDGLLKVAEFEF